VVFDEFTRVGSEILDTLAGPSAKTKAKDDLRRYLSLLDEIYGLLAQVHDKVADVAVRVTLADTLDEARQIMEGVEQASLTDTFRAQDWCDQFEELGHSLREVGQQGGLSPADQQTWDAFCTVLENREAQVAMLFDTNLYELRHLADGNPPLDVFKQQVEGITEQLVTQKAEFDLLAKRAAALRARLK